MKVRKIVSAEEMYADVQDVSNSYTVHNIIEYSNAIGYDKLNNAFREAISYCNGVCVRKKGNYWISSDDKINLEEITFETYDNYINNKFFNEVLDYKLESLKGYVIHFRDSKKSLIVFRFFHGVIDGKGAILLMENFLKALNKMELVQCTNQYNILDLIDKNKFKKLKENNKPNHSLKNFCTIDSKKLFWTKIKIDRYVPSVVAKIAKIIQEEFENESVKFMIPVDLRHYNREKNYLGNIILPIYLQVNREDSINNIAGKMMMKLKNTDELNINNINNMNYNLIPKPIRKLGLKMFFSTIHNKNKFFVGAIISHLGRIDITKYNKINIDDMIFLPNHQPLTPFSINITEFNNETNVVICTFENQIPEKTLNSLKRKIGELK